MADRDTGSPFPSVDRITRHPDLRELNKTHGHTSVVDAARQVLARHRAKISSGEELPTEEQIVAEVSISLERRDARLLKRVFNLTGTVLHTNLGRAILPKSAIDHVTMSMREFVNIEFDLDRGSRGERDELVAELLTELSGAEAATVVNNNAAAVLLVLAALAGRREVVVSRGELIEIGGSFRIPDIMRSANARLVEVGTTNRTHPSDYEEAVGPRTAALMKVHASNYEIRGFVADVGHSELARIAHRHDLPLIVDLGAGSLVDLTMYDLPKEPVVRDIVDAGADLLTFSGDKLLGGPQAGLIVGRKALIERINRHPIKRALRVSKMTLAALEATLLEYRKPDLLAKKLPSLRLLTRALDELKALAERLEPQVAAVLGTSWQVTVDTVASQVGSGSLPSEVLPSIALALRPARGKSGSALKDLAAKLRQLPVPVIGRVADDRLLLDLRCLEDEGCFAAQLTRLRTADGRPE
jgi:L-seryl-tRNA(Ser) seleniumtransferase